MTEFNFIADQTFISKRIRIYLLKLGIESEFESAKIIISFYEFIKNRIDYNSKIIPTSKCWIYWLEFIDKEKLKPSLLKTENKDLKFASMTPKKDLHLHSRNKKGQLTPKISPFLLLLSLIFWSIIYYILIFKVVKI